VADQRLAARNFKLRPRHADLRGMQTKLVTLRTAVREWWQAWVEDEQPY
jgi:hypothetical protein